MFGVLLLTVVCAVLAFLIKAPLWLRIAVVLIIPVLVGITFLLVYLLPLGI